MKKFLFPVIGLVAISAIGLGFTQKQGSVSQNLPVFNTHADYRTYNTLADLENGADAILLVAPTQRFMDRKHIVTFFEEDKNTMQDYYTLTELKVFKVLKADDVTFKDNKYIEVVEPISIVKQVGKDVIFATDGYVEMERNEKYVVFLKKNQSGKYRILNMNNGKFSHYINKPRKEDMHTNQQLRAEVLKKYLND